MSLRRITEVCCAQQHENKFSTLLKLSAMRYVEAVLRLGHAVGSGSTDTVLSARLNRRVLLRRLVAFIAAHRDVPVEAQVSGAFKPQRF